MKSRLLNRYEIIFFSLILSFTMTPRAGAEKQVIQMAIVLDDIGNSLHDFQALSLPPAVTFAILPYTPHAKQIATLASQQNRELLIHVPMQAKSHNEQLGKGALMLDMSEQQFKQRLSNAINYLPNAYGISNHMGSAMTEQLTHMQWTMDILEHRGLYFLDSRTTANTVIEYCAQISNIPTLRRHVFLDNIKTNDAMEKQFQHAIELGEKNFSVVMIAHPYPITLKFLSEKLKGYNPGVKLVALQALLPRKVRLAMAKKRNELHDNNIMLTDVVNAQTIHTQ